VRRLVKVAEAKGRPLSYSDAHSIVNLKLGVEDVEHLTPEQIPAAMRLVGELLQTIVLEGEYIPRGQPPDPVSSAPAYQPLTAEQQRAIQERIRSLAANWLLNAQSTDAWVYNHLRVAFQVAKWTDIESSQYEAALALVESKAEAARQLLAAVSELRA
jgi:hypothetical protein